VRPHTPMRREAETGRREKAQPRVTTYNGGPFAWLSSLPRLGRLDLQCPGTSSSFHSSRSRQHSKVRQRPRPSKPSPQPYRGGDRQAYTLSPNCQGGGAQRRREHVSARRELPGEKSLPGMGSDRAWELAHQNRSMQARGGPGVVSKNRPRALTTSKSLRRGPNHRSTGAWPEAKPS